MYRTNNNKSSKRHNRFNPAWNRRELTPRLLTDCHIDISKENNVIAVEFDRSSRIYVVKKEAAFLFGQSPKELFVRTNFGCFVVFGNGDDYDDDVAELCEELYNSEFAGLIDPALFYPNNLLYNIPVYHDALAMIPRPVEPVRRPGRGFHPPTMPW